MMRALVGRSVYRFRLVIGVARFGDRWSDRVRLALFMMVMPPLKRLGRNWRTRHRLRLDEQVVDWEADSDADLAIIEEIFGRRVYDLPDVSAPRVVVDLGAHVGATVLFFALRFPTARIIAVEPDPVNFAKLRRNVGFIPQVTLINTAVSEREGTIAFYSAGQLDGWKSSSMRPASPWQQQIEVHSTTLDRLLADAKVESADLLKIDIEGGEYDVLRSFAGLASVRTIVGEVHPELMSGSVDAFVDLLRDFQADLPATLTQDTNFRADRRDPITASAGPSSR